MPSLMLRLFVLVAAAVLAALPASAFDTRARAAWVYDLTTRTVLLEKDADLPLPPASMSKLMTLNMMFEALREGRVGLDTTFAVSTRAKEMGGSTMFLNEMDRPTVQELMKGIVINSGNDACVAVAEGLAGSEEAFAASMTELELLDIGAGGFAHHLMPEADAEHRHLSEQLLHLGIRARDRIGVAGSVA